MPLPIFCKLQALYIMCAAGPGESGEALSRHDLPTAKVWANANDQSQIALTPGDWPRAPSSQSRGDSQSEWPSVIMARMLRVLPRLKFLEPQLPTLVRRHPPGQRWIHEIKHNGYRSQLMIERG